MYSASHVRPTYQLLLSYDYRLLSYEYWISDHIFVIWNSQVFFTFISGNTKCRSLLTEQTDPVSPGPDQDLYTTHAQEILKLDLNTR